MARRIASAKSLIKKNNFKLIDVEPLTAAQEVLFDNYDCGYSQVLLGSPGTGKTFLSLYLAFDEIINTSNKFRRIVIVRSAVSTRDVGHLPGTLEDKQAIYELPYQGIVSELFGRGDAYGVLKKHSVVDFMLTSYVRGITLDNTLIIVDECQNMTAHELESVITRLGRDSKIIFCGDEMQTDFTNNREKNFDEFFSVLKRMPAWIKFNHFNYGDIVRSGIVRDYIIAKEKPNG